MLQFDEGMRFWRNFKTFFSLGIEVLVPPILRGILTMAKMARMTKKCAIFSLPKIGNDETLQPGHFRFSSY
jgi:hypothetical protein